MHIFKPWQNQAWVAVQSLGMLLPTSIFLYLDEIIQNSVICFMAAPLALCSDTKIIKNADQCWMKQLTKFY